MMTRQIGLEMHGHGSTIKPNVGEAATWQGGWFNSSPPTLSSWPDGKSLSICIHFNSLTRGNYVFGYGVVIIF